jgi:hypothetical protein
MSDHQAEPSQSSIAPGKREQPFSGEYLPDNPNARWAIADVLTRIASAEEAERARRRADPAVSAEPRQRRKEPQRKFETAATAVVAELVVALAGGGECHLFVSRRKDYLEQEDRYRSEAINTLLPAALDQLEALGFISQVKGYITDSGDRRRTVISPGPALSELVETYALGADDFRRERAGDEIVLKERSGDAPIAYTDDGDTRRMRAEMQAINRFLHEADVGLSAVGADDPFDDIDLTKRKLRRIFSRGTFAEGGRLFGAFWQDLKGRQRRERLLIDGKPVVELDLSAAGLRFLYGVAGAQPPDGDLYHLPDLPAADRDDVKAMIAALTFIDPVDLLKLAPWARRMRPDLGARRHADAFERHMSDEAAVEVVLQAIRRTHAPVAAYLPSLIGHRLQRIESDTMVSILLGLNGKGIVALPIHDSVILRHDHADVAQAVMEECLRVATGAATLLRVKTGR